MRKQYTTMDEFSKNSLIDLYGADLSLIHNFVSSPYNKIIDLSTAKGLNGNLDLSRAEYVDLSFTDVTNVQNLKLNPKARSLTLSNVIGLTGFLDCSKVDSLYFKGLDFAILRIGFNSKASRIYIPFARNLRDVLDFGGVQELTLASSDVSKVDVLKLNPNARKLDLSNVIGLRGVLYFNNVSKLSLCYTDLSNVPQIQFNKHANLIDLAATKGLKGVLDFGFAQRVNMRNADLSNVPQIICGSNTVLQNLPVNWHGEIIRRGVPTNAQSLAKLKNKNRSK